MKRCIRCGRRRKLSSFHRLTVFTVTGRLIKHRPDCRDCRNDYERRRTAWQQVHW